MRRTRAAAASLTVGKTADVEAQEARHLGAVDGVGGDELVEVAHPVLLHALRLHRCSFPSVAGLCGCDSTASLGFLGKPRESLGRRSWPGSRPERRGGGREIG
jgi:hypothetical protein